MEINELKDLIEDKPISYSKSELESIFSIKTKREIDGINRKMRWDMISMVIVALGIIGLAFALGLRDRLSLTAEVALLVGLISIHYRVKYLKIGKINLAKYDLTTGIRKAINSLTLYLKLYKIVIPVFASTFYSYQRWKLLKVSNNIPDKVTEMLLEIGLILLVGIIVYFLSKWLSDKLYGEELSKMRSYLHKIS